MNSVVSAKTIIVDVNAGDQITTGTCSHIVVEIIKYIVYQRLQIPYTYQWLKHLVGKKKNRDEQGKKDCLISMRHFRTACAALDNLDSIIKSLIQEINGPVLPEEVCIMFGATPVTNREVYRLLLPPLCHKPQCHNSNVKSEQKVQMNVFRTFITSGLHAKMFLEPMQPTNMYVFIKKNNVCNTGNVLVNNENFFFTSGYKFPRKSKIAVLDFRKQNTDVFACCNDFQIFQDVICDTMAEMNVSDEQDHKNDKYTEIKSSDMTKWFQSSFVLKGFKDCSINGGSITNMWLAQ